MKKITLLSILLLSILAASCSGSNNAAIPEGVQIRSVDEIIDGPLEITNFANDGSASLPLQTSVSVACTIVYGKTPDFGSLSLDQDMAGGTHSDHNPLLSGLEPETTYYYRVQGVDDDGIIYLSDVMTFTTPPLDDSPVENLASPLMGAEITGFSSAFGGAAPEERWGAQSAFDDNPNTEWSSAGDGNNAWVEVKLAQRARVDAVSFQSRAMSDGTAITLAFQVTTESGEIFGPFLVDDTDKPFEFDVSIEAETLRFDLVDTTGGNTGVVDIAVFGDFID